MGLLADWTWLRREPLNWRLSRCVCASTGQYKQDKRPGESTLPSSCTQLATAPRAASALPGASSCPHTCPAAWRPLPRPASGLGRPGRRRCGAVSAGASSPCTPHGGKCKGPSCSRSRRLHGPGRREPEPRPLPRAAGLLTPWSSWARAPGLSGRLCVGTGGVAGWLPPSLPLLTPEKRMLASDATGPEDVVHPAPCPAPGLVFEALWRG